MGPRRRRITGTVARALIAPRSKSQHVGIVLRTAAAEEYVLRRRGGNAFHDPVLERLVGATITGLGLVTNRNFIMDEFKVERGGCRGLT
jgi:hypothetical protein